MLVVLVTRPIAHLIHVLGWPEPHVNIVWLQPHSCVGLARTVHITSYLTANLVTSLPKTRMHTLYIIHRVVANPIRVQSKPCGAAQFRPLCRLRYFTTLQVLRFMFVYELSSVIV
jgi:hypothetical protein